MRCGPVRLWTSHNYYRLLLFQRGESNKEAENKQYIKEQFINKTMSIHSKKIHKISNEMGHLKRLIKINFFYNELLQKAKG